MVERNGPFAELSEEMEAKSRGWYLFEYLKAEIVSEIGLLLYLMIQLNIIMTHSIDIILDKNGLRVIKHPYLIAKLRWWRPKPL